MGKIPTDGEWYAPIFWRACDYATFEDAEKDGATYNGESCCSYSSFMDSLCQCRAALRCVGMSDSLLTARVFVDGKFACDEQV
jgi:hypothetical protein